MTAGILIRRMRPGDMAAVVDLCREHAEFEQAPFAVCSPISTRQMGKRLGAYIFGTPEHILCWVVEVAGDLVGYATATLEFSTWDAAHYLHMDCLFLRPSFRGRRIGSQLMSLVAAEAVERNAVGLRWQTPEWNYEAIHFYGRTGARQDSKLRFTLDREGCVRQAKAAHPI